MKTSVDSIVYGDFVATMDSENPVIENGAVAIDQGCFCAVGSKRDVEARFTSTTKFSGKDRILLPGLINGHTHATMTLFRGYADDLSLKEWLEEHIFPLEAAVLSPEMVEIGTRLACWEMLCGGTTSFADMYMFHEEIANVVDEIGIRAWVAATIANVPRNDAKNMEDQWLQAQEFVQKWSKQNTTVHPILAGHSIYTLDRQELIELRDLANQLNVPVHIHLSETQFEVDYAKEHYQSTPIRFLDDIGFFDNSVIAAHVVWPQDGEMEILANKNVAAIHNPSSNAKLASGFSPVSAMLEHGVCVGLGTDGTASNNDLDLWEEMRLATFLQKLNSMNPTELPAQQTLEVATTNGARAFGAAHNLGKLKEGFCADLIQVELRNAHQLPIYDVFSHLVYTTHIHDVVNVFVNGRVLLQNREPTTIDVEQLRSDVSRMTKEIRSIRK
ncbi:MAG: amidohydrolase [Gammaproteobacteria bacterium]|nr:amidohydrolase [Gammaproteobacteria bacterium]MDE0253111.1 amidohydrolase [Gammaproteobacteria bacterium]MDE0402941.1 amidohydrolase [Gammaproteobacteria bacterium]